MDANSGNQKGSLKENYKSNDKRGKNVTKRGNKTPRYANGGQIPDSHTQKFADGGDVLQPGDIPLEQFELMNKSQPAVDKLSQSQTKHVSIAPNLSQLHQNGAIEELQEGDIPIEEFNEQKYGTPSQMAITALEGAAKGVAGPAATYAEKNLLGIPEEDIRGREEANPITHGASEISGFGASMLTGQGIGSAIAHAGEAVVGAAKLAEASSIGQKIAAGALQGATEMGLIQGSDEVSKMILNDPHQSWQTAAMSIPMSAALGAVGGGALASINPIWKAAYGSKAGQFIEDIKGELGKMAKGAVPEKLVSDELNAHYAGLRGSIDKLESMPIESKAVEKLLPEMRKSIESFEKRFTTEIEGNKVVDLDKIYHVKEPKLKEIADSSTIDGTNKELKLKAGAEKTLNHYLDTSEKFTNAVDKHFAELGMDNPIPPSSLSSVRNTLGETTEGSKLAQAWAKNAVNGATEGMAASVGGYLGHSTGIPYAGVIGAYIGTKAFGPLFKTIMPSIAKSLIDKTASGTGFRSAIDYAVAVIKGDNLMGKAAKNLFKAGAEILPEHAMPSEHGVKKLDAMLQEVHSDPAPLVRAGDQIGHYLPDHSVAAVSALTRGVQYLNSVRPVQIKANPLDSLPPISSDKKAQWNRTLEIAEQPLSVLNRVKEGTITPRDIQDLKNLAPEAYGRISQKITSELISHVDKGELVPYKTRIGLSLFLGQGMDSTLTPNGIMSAQPTPQQPQQPQGSQQKGSSKSSTTSLNKISQSYRTPTQANAESRQKVE